MKLKTKIKELNKEELVHIGSKSGFFFIGYPDDFEKEIESLNLKHRNNFERTLHNAQAKYISLYQNKPGKDKKEVIKVWVNGKSVYKEVDYNYLIKKWKDRIEQLKETIAKYKELLKTFKDFRERDILDCYRNIDNNATILIVSGSECGRFWSYNEVLRHKQGYKIVEEDDEYEEYEGEEYYE